MDFDNQIEQKRDKPLLIAGVGAGSLSNNEETRLTVGWTVLSDTRNWFATTEPYANACFTFTSI